MKENTKAVRAELQRISAAHGGLLKPSDVVKAARVKTSPLHSRFQWDDTKAGHAYRLFQARQLIRICVHVIPNGVETPQRVWVSLNRDPEPEGYRSLVAVMSDKQMREALLQQALEEMERFQDKFSELKELADVFASMRKAQRILLQSEMKQAA